MCQFKNVIFFTVYLNESVKSQERLRRGTSENNLIKGSNTRTPLVFLHNDQTQTQLFDKMLKVRTSTEAAAILMGTKVILVVDGYAYLLTSVDGKSGKTP